MARLRSVPLLLLLAIAPLAPALAINLNPSMEELREEAFVQWRKWIAGRDQEKRRIAADNLGSFEERPEAVVLLAGALRDADPEVRRLAATSLWKLGDREARLEAALPALRGALQDRVPAVQVQAAGALERAGVDPRELVAARQRVLADGDSFDVALAARDLIGHVDGASLVEPLLFSLRQAPPTRDDDAFDAGDVLPALAQRGGPGAVAGLMRALDDPALPKVPLLEALMTLETPPAGWSAALQRLLRDPESSTRAKAADAYETLIERDGAVAVPPAPLLPLLRDRYGEVRLEAAEALGAAGGAAHAALADLLALAQRDPEPRVRRAALRALAPIGDPAEAYERDAKARVAAQARPVLEAIAADGAQEDDAREIARETLRVLAAGSAPHTRVLTPSAPSDAGALARLRARGVEFTEDAFWRALGEREVETVQDLLAAGIDPKTSTDDGMPALHFMLMGGCDYGRPTAEATRKIVAALLAAGADPNQIEPGGDNPALHRATSCDAAVVKQLVAAKADVRARNASGLTAFTMFVLTSPSGAGALLDAGYRASGAERATLQSMLQGEKDPARRRLLQRALGQ
jgi:HEAT repeat protein